MKYTTKSGKELPPEVVEVIGQLKKENYSLGNTWNLNCANLDEATKLMLIDVWEDDFTEFYKLYPKKDYDSFGNEIVKGDSVQVSDDEEDLKDSVPTEFVGIAEKSTCKYIVYVNMYNAATSYKFCRKINTNETKKSELQSQMCDVLARVKEIEAKINEL